MRSDINELLARETADTLEKLAFIFAFPAEPDAQEDAGTQRIAACVSFRGPFNGSLAIHLPETMLPEMTVNMLGLDDDEPVSVEHQRDALKEALNIICGNLLPAIAGKEAVFDLDAPLVLDRSADEPAGRLTGRAVLALDDGAVEVRLYLEGEPAAEISL